jgi:CubicO group peptidase (beta-lactamase class C family)
MANLHARSAGYGFGGACQTGRFGKSHRLDSLLLVRHGRIVLDAYYAPYTADIPHAINSSTKAVAGTLTALLYKDGLPDRLDHPILDFFADRSIANVDDRKKAITVQNLLDMTSGFDWEEGIEGGGEQSAVEVGRSTDWVKFVLDRPMSHAPGDLFYYNSGNPHLLSAITTKLTGMTAQEYANAKLFSPLGIAASTWRRDPQGLSIGGGGLALRPRDMAKIGYLYLRDGEWEDKRLLPPGWVERLSDATVNMNASFDPHLGNSDFFWVMPNKKAYMVWGYHCQAIMGFPELDMVAVTTARELCPFGKLAGGRPRSNPKASYPRIPPVQICLPTKSAISRRRRRPRLAPRPRPRRPSLERSGNFPTMR